MQLWAVNSPPRLEKANCSDKCHCDPSQKQPQPRIAPEPGFWQAWGVRTQRYGGDLQEEIKPLQQKAEGHHGDCSAHPSQKGPLVRCMIAVTFYHLDPSFVCRGPPLKLI